MFRFALVIVLCLVMAFPVDACNRCGLFGNRCRFKAVEAHHVEHYRNDYQQDVFVVQNNYPAPLVAQGSSLYASTPGYQQLVAPILLDPNQYFSQELQLLKAANDTNALRAERSQALFQRALELQAPVAEKLATGQAAKMVLDAAGLNATASVHAQQQAVVIDRDQLGRLHVRTLTAEQVQLLTNQISEKIADKAEEAATPPAAGKYPTLTQYCGKCHGLDLAEPKGSLHLGSDPNVATAMRERFFKITRAVSTGHMPPASAPQPSPEEKAAILNEIEAIIVAEGKG